jgi:isocitrate lyase
MTLIHLFLIHRYRIFSVHYLTPTEDNQRQTEGMKAMGIFEAVKDEVGDIIVADVNAERLQDLLGSDQVELRKLVGNPSK